MKNTLAIKANAYNRIQRYFSPSDREMYELSPQQKLKAIREIINEQRELLYQYKRKRKERRLIADRRFFAAKPRKRRTSKEEWEAMQRQGNGFAPHLHHHDEAWYDPIEGIADDY